ncbi:MAG: DnaA/Hda family protein [Pseudomonadota bacterium]|nr:DnaA/Hda family protein [Pseudomonadota bacterium]
MRQLSLSIDSRPDAQIGDFAGPSWVPVIDAVRQLHAGLLQRLYLHGEADSGKSHLLSAICESYQDMHRSAIQVSLIELLDAPTEALAALESFDLVALDDLEAIRGVPHWQEAIFHLINRSSVGESQLIFASRLPPLALRLELPDLMSRLSQAASFQLPSGESLEDRQALLDAVLKRRGWSFEPQIIEHILQHGPHRAGLMLKTLNQLETFFHTQRRKPSASMIRQVLSMIDSQSVNH